MRTREVLRILLMVACAAFDPVDTHPIPLPWPVGAVGNDTIRFELKARKLKNVSGQRVHLVLDTLVSIEDLYNIVALVARNHRGEIYPTTDADSSAGKRINVDLPVNSSIAEILRRSVSFAQRSLHANLSHYNDAEVPDGVDNFLHIREREKKKEKKDEVVAAINKENTRVDIDKDLSQFETKQRFLSMVNDLRTKPEVLRATMRRFNSAAKTVLFDVLEELKSHATRRSSEALQYRRSLNLIGEVMDTLEEVLHALQKKPVGSKKTIIEDYSTTSGRRGENIDFDELSLKRLLREAKALHREVTARRHLVLDRRRSYRDDDSEESEHDSEIERVLTTLMERAMDDEEVDEDHPRPFVDQLIVKPESNNDTALRDVRSALEVKAREEEESKANSTDAPTRRNGTPSAPESKVTKLKRIFPEADRNTAQPLREITTTDRAASHGFIEKQEPVRNGAPERSEMGTIVRFGSDEAWNLNGHVDTNLTKRAKKESKLKKATETRSPLGTGAEAKTKSSRILSNGEEGFTRKMLAVSSAELFEDASSSALESRPIAAINQTRDAVSAAATIANSSRRKVNLSVTSPRKSERSNVIYNQNKNIIRNVVIKKPSNVDNVSTTLGTSTRKDKEAREMVKKSISKSIKNLISGMLPLINSGGINNGNKMKGSLTAMNTSNENRPLKEISTPTNDDRIVESNDISLISRKPIYDLIMLKNITVNSKSLDRLENSKKIESFDSTTHGGKFAMDDILEAIDGVVPTKKRQNSGILR